MDICELVRISREQIFTEEDDIYFVNGTNVKIKEEAKYLGGWLNNRGDPGQEVRQRIST